MVIAAFVVYQAYKWASARKNKDYAAVPGPTTISSLLSASLLVSDVNGAGFEYPPFPDPIMMQNFVIATGIPFIQEFETPIQVRITAAQVETFWQCLAVYHPTALGVFTRQRFVTLRSNSFMHTFGCTQTRRGGRR